MSDNHVCIAKVSYLEPESQDSEEYLRVVLSRLEPIWQTSLYSCGRSIEELVELILQVGDCPKAIFDDGEKRKPVLLTKHPRCEKRHLVAFLDSFFRGAVATGFVEARCIPGTLHRLSVLQEPRSETSQPWAVHIRFGRSLDGVFGRMCPWLYGPKCLQTIQNISAINFSGKSVLLIARQGMGKTTVLRDIMNWFYKAFRNDHNAQRPMILVSKSQEIRVIDGVIDGREASQLLAETDDDAIPNVAFLDDICDAAEVAFARKLATRRTRIIATVQGNTFVDIVKCGVRNLLMGGLKATRRTANPYEPLKRSSTPIFDMAVELHQRDCWILHPNLKQAIDRYLCGGTIDAIELQPGMASATMGIPGREAMDYCCVCPTGRCSAHQQSIPLVPLAPLAVVGAVTPREEPLARLSPRVGAAEALEENEALPRLQKANPRRAASRELLGRTVSQTSVISYTHAKQHVVLVGSGQSPQESVVADLVHEIARRGLRSRCVFHSKLVGGMQDTFSKRMREKLIPVSKEISGHGGLLGDVYILLQGGSTTLDEAMTALKNRRIVLPYQRRFIPLAAWGAEKTQSESNYNDLVLRKAFSNYSKLPNSKQHVVSMHDFVRLTAEQVVAIIEDICFS